MNLDFDSAAARGLRRYVRLVAAALEPNVVCSAVHWDHPVNAFLTLTGRLRWFPSREVALRWDSRHGWAMVLPTYASEPLAVLRYLGHDILPPPREVAAFRGRLFGDELAGQAYPPSAISPDLVPRLAAYATPCRVRHREDRPVHLYGVITSLPGRA